MLNKYLSDLIQLRSGIRQCSKFLQYFRLPSGYQVQNVEIPEWSRTATKKI
jgi:hypothetical protein